MSLDSFYHCLDEVYVVYEIILQQNILQYQAIVIRLH